MRKNGPKLASGERITVNISDHAPRLGSSSGVVNTGTKKEPIPKRAMRTIAGFLLLAVLVTFLTYVTLATTVFVVMRADGHNVAVLRNTYPVGSVPSGAIVYASSAPADRSFLGKVNQAVFGVPAGSVVEIVAGPSANIATDKNHTILVNGHPTAYHGAVDPQALSHEYLAICLTGACQANAAVLVGEDNIIGGVKGYLTLHGITHPDTVAATGGRK